MASSSQTSDVLAPGTLVGSYEVMELIGSGGMGEVYRAKHRAIGRIAAVKVLNAERAQDAKAVGLFLEEAKTLGALSHRNLVEVLDFGHLASGQPFLTMAYVDGKTLHELVNESLDATGAALTVAYSLSITEQVLNALGEAHKKGIVHRDLKPSNIMVLREHSGELLVKVLDFGLSRPMPGAVLPWAGLRSTKQSSAAGTPAYVSPEGVRNAELDGRADLYSLGCTLFEMLAGRAPFVADSPLELVTMHLETEPPRPSELVPSLPEEVERLVLWFLQKDREQRPESADVARLEVRRILAKLAKETTVVRASTLPPLRRLSTDALPAASMPAAPSTAKELSRPKRRWVPALAAIASLVVLGLGLVVLLREPGAQVHAVVVPPQEPPRLEAPQDPPQPPPPAAVDSPPAPTEREPIATPDEGDLQPVLQRKAPPKVASKPPKIDCTWSDTFQSYARREHQARQQAASKRGAPGSVLDALESDFGDAMVRRDCQGAQRILDKLAQYARSP